MREKLVKRYHQSLTELAEKSEPSRLARLKAMAPATRFVLRGGPDSRTAAGEVFGVGLPTTACRAATSGDRFALWLGPDEWLLVAAEGDKHSLQTALAAALGSRSASLVDVSHRQAAIEISGPKAAEVLNAFVPLDLELSTCPVGMCTRTIFGKAEIVLWRTAAETFRIEVLRSFAPYVRACLEEARREHLD